MFVSVIVAAVKRFKTTKQIQREQRAGVEREDSILREKRTRVDDHDRANLKHTSRTS